MEQQLILEQQGLRERIPWFLALRGQQGLPELPPLYLDQRERLVQALQEIPDLLAARASPL
jgi:hypothetical protein